MKVNTPLSTSNLMKNHSLKSKFLHFACLAVGGIFAFVIFANDVYAATRTWDGGGVDTNWSTAANWSSDTVPVSGDTVTFDGTSTNNSTVDAGFAGTITTMNINSGYTGTITLARSLTVSGNFTQNAGTFAGADQTLDLNDGSFSLTSGTFTVPTTAFTIERNFTVSGGTFNSTATTTFDST